MLGDILAEALFNACLAGDAAAVSLLLPAGGTQLNLSAARFQDPDFKSMPLIKAAVRGHIEIVRMILERALDTDVDYEDDDGGTALMAAAQYHHVDVLRLLADHGGNVNHLNKWRETALRAAVSTLHPDDLTRDPDGRRQVATVRALLQLGAGTLPSSPPSPRPLPPPAPPAISFSRKTYLRKYIPVACATHGLIRLTTSPRPSPHSPRPRRREGRVTALDRLRARQRPGRRRASGRWRGHRLHHAAPPRMPGGRLHAAHDRRGRAVQGGTGAKAEAWCLLIRADTSHSGCRLKL